MKSDVVAKHLLAGNSCGNCKSFTIHKIITIVENPSPADEGIEWTNDGRAYKMFNIKKCTHDLEPEEGVCDQWEKYEDVVWGDLMSVYTTEIFDD